jgi:hypothetical protein
VWRGESSGSAEASRKSYTNMRLFKGTAGRDFCEMVRLNVCLTGEEGRELWFSRGIEEILHKHRIALKGQQHEIFVRLVVCMSI